MTMIEKIVRVIWKDLKGYEITDDILKNSVAGKSILHISKSILEAMKEPSEGMCEAVGNDTNKIEGYEFMIEAALKE